MLYAQAVSARITDMAFGEEKQIRFQVGSVSRSWTHNHFVC